MYTSSKRQHVNALRGDNEIVAAVFVFQFDGAEVFSGFENACNGEKRAVAMLQEWEQNPDHPLKWCGNFHPGANGKRPDNILSCGGAVCILFGGMRLLNSEEKKRSKEVQARGKAEREAKKKTKREASAAPARAEGYLGRAREAKKAKASGP